MTWSRLFRKLSPTRKAKPFAQRFRPRVEGLESRLVPYSVSGNVWPHGNLVTISFMPDGTNLGTTTSNLFSTFNGRFGSAAAWQNVILKAAQQWAQQTNLNFAVVSDDGSAAGSGSYQQGDPGMGDIRVGGYNFGNCTLAQAYLPPSVNNYSIAGDISFNTAQPFNINGQAYDLFTVALHEFGHALGLYHSGTPGAAMYPSYSGVLNGLAADDINGIRDIYSSDLPRTPDAYDAAASNGSFSTAGDITSYINTWNDTALVPGLDITTTADTDYYKFTAPSGGTGALTVKVQSSGLSLLAPKVWVYNASQTQIAYASGLNQYGTTVTATVGSGIVAGQTYYVKVAGADTTAFGTGAYALTLNMGTGTALTVPPPNTQTANGSPKSGGGGIALAQAQEYMVNTTTADVQQTFWQTQQAVATDSQGNYVVTWSSHNQDGSGWGVYAQRFNSAGTPQGTEFRVNTTTAGDQMYPAVAMDANGNFVITWSSNGQDGSGWGVYAQMFTASGTPAGGEFRVNTTTAGDQMFSSVATDGLTPPAPSGGSLVNATTHLLANTVTNLTGGFIITWQSHDQDGSGWGVYGQMYGADGTPRGGEFRVNTTTQDDQAYANVAMNASGNFVVTWSSHNQDGYGWGVYAQMYGATGAPVGGEFRVNTTTQDDQTYPAVAMNGTGTFVVTWASHNQDGSGWGVYAQTYDPAGIPLGGEISVNTYTAGDQMYPAVVMKADGDFLVTWSSNGQDGNGWGVYGRQFDYTGVASGDEFQVNTTTAGNQQYASASFATSGRLVIVWSGNGGGDTSGVFSRRYVIGADDYSVPTGSDAPTASDPGATASLATALAADANHSSFSLPGDQRQDRDDGAAAFRVAQTVWESDPGVTDACFTDPTWLTPAARDDGDAVAVLVPDGLSGI